MRLKVCVITGSRSEYGLMRWLIQDLSEDPAIDFKLIVMGAHWMKEYGYTYKEIEKDRIPIHARVYSKWDSRSAVSLAHAVGRWTGQLADTLQKINPDVVMIMGDRYELLSVC